jgi:addiction module RelE/StbE family toxin
MVQIRWTNLAVKDLNNIFEYISVDSIYYAKIQILKLKLRTRILKSHPFSGKIVSEYKQESFRELIDGNYRIIYKVVNQNQIDILTIHHTYRDLGRRDII